MSVDESVFEEAEIRKRPLSELKLWDKNPRRGTKIQMDKLRKKILKHKFYRPLITNKEGIIIGGNSRFRILKELGVKEVNCSIVEPVSEAEFIEIAISDNEQDTEWVEEELAELIHDQPIELDLYSVHLSQPITLAKLMEQESDNTVDKVELTCPECGHTNTPSAFKAIK